MYPFDVPGSARTRKNRLFCPCHQGAFDIRTGDAIMGPPRAPLPKITIAIAADGAISATGVHRGGSENADSVAGNVDSLSVAARSEQEA